MCGRFAQYRIAYEYLDKIAVQLPLPLRGSVNPEPIGRYNVCPQSMVQLLHQDDGGCAWNQSSGVMPRCGHRGKRPPAINARVETAATSRFIRDIWQTGHAIVPADGWYGVEEGRGESEDQAALLHHAP